jgi:hypothetical protein
VVPDAAMTVGQTVQLLGMATLVTMVEAVKEAAAWSRVCS